MVIAAYNAVHHETIGYSPYHLMFGSEYQIPLDLTLNIPEEASPLNLGDSAAQLLERIQTAYEVVNQHLHTKMERMKRRCDAKYIHYSIAAAIGRIRTVLLPSA